MKKVLIITYYWPPAGGPGVQRVLKFAKYLPQFGWEPIILTVENGNFPAIDKGLLDEIPPELKVYKTKTLEPFAIYNRLQGKDKSASIDTFTITKTGQSFKEKLGKAVRSYCFIPDARKGWKPFAVKAGMDIIKNEKIDLIFSSSPPHSLQLIAKSLAVKAKLPWVADFRDPWSTAFWLDDDQKTGWVNKTNVSKERSVFASLTHFTTVSRGVLDSFKSLYPRIEGCSSLLYNGYDEADYQAYDSTKNPCFTIRYIGTLAQTQNPELLFNALAQLRAEKPEMAQLIKVEFWGKFDRAIKTSVDKCQLNDAVSFHPYVSHQKAVALMQTSDLLILVIPYGASVGILTGKLFEYMATGNPILGFGPKGCEAQQLVEDEKLGVFPQDIPQLLTELENMLDKWKTKEQLISQGTNEQFSRRLLTKKLSEVFDKTLKGCK